MNFDQDYIKNIEYLKSANGAVNTLTLSYSDVMSMTDDRNTLMINADSADTVNFDAEGNYFVKTGTRGADGTNFDVWTDGNVTLLISNDTNVAGADTGNIA